MRHHPSLFSLVPVALITLLVAAAPAGAAHGPEERAGRRGLVFGFNGESFTSFDGATLAIRQQLGERTGLRLGLDIGLSAFDSKIASTQRDELVYPDSTVVDVRDAERSVDDDVVDLDLDLLLIRHSATDRPLRFFYGAGPVVAYSHRDETTRSADVDEDDIRTRTTTLEATTWRYGLRMIVGVEWFITEEISVHAEYAAGALFRDGKTTRTAIEEREVLVEGPIDRRTEFHETDRNDGWDLDTHGARFGVSLFF
jgi:hypothetical protein